MESSDLKVELLQSQAIFGGIRDDIIELILKRSACVDIPKGEAFFQEGDSARSMYVLEQGRVAVTMGGEEKEITLRELESGDCFGEMALMDFKCRSATVVALEDCSAIEITTATLHQIFTEDPEQFAMIGMNMGREVSRRLRETDERLAQRSR